MVSSERSSSSNTAILPAFAPVEPHSCISWDWSFKAVKEASCRCTLCSRAECFIQFYPMRSSRSRLFLSRLEYFKWISLLDINMLYPLRLYHFHPNINRPSQLDSLTPFEQQNTNVKSFFFCKAWNASGIQFVTWALRAATGLSRCIRPWFTDLCHWGRWVMSHVPIHRSCYN